jgi:hypothetical protein
MQVARVYAARSGAGLRLSLAVLSLSPFAAQFLCLVVGWAATPEMLASGLTEARSDDLLFEVLMVMVIVVVIMISCGCCYCYCAVVIIVIVWWLLLLLLLCGCCCCCCCCCDCDCCDDL